MAHLGNPIKRHQLPPIARILIISAGIISAILIALILAKPANTPALTIQHPADSKTFDPSFNWVMSNDVLVLSAILNDYCKHVTAKTVLSDLTLDERSSGGRLAQKLPVTPTCGELILAPNSEIDLAFSRDRSIHKRGLGWPGFYAAYPSATGLMRVSMPVYEDENKASVEISATCDSLCGAGFHISLKRTPAGQWVILNKAPTWIS